MSFVETVRAAKGVKARNLIPSCESIPDLEELLKADPRKIVTMAARSRLNALRAKESRAAEDGVTPDPEETEPEAINRVRVEEADTKTCPACGNSGLIAELFGVRKMKRVRADGIEVVTTRAQSHCKKCRGKKKKKGE
jgi:hypothetical protein